MNTVEIVLTILGSSTLFEFIKWFVGRNDSRKCYATKSDLDSIKDGLMALCQTTLEEKMQHYLNIGEITDNQYKALTTTVKAYEKLDGDDFVHDLWETCKELYQECKKVDVTREE